MDRIRQLVVRLAEERGTTLKALSLAMERNHAYLHQYVHLGKPIELKERDREKLAELLNIEQADLKMTPREITEASRHAGIILDEAGRFVADKYVPPRELHPAALRVLEYDVAASAGPGLEVEENYGDNSPVILGEWSMPSDMVRAHTTPDARLAVVRVEGDSMRPDYLPGDRVLVDLSRRKPTPSGVFVIWDGMGLVLKRLDLVIGSTPLRVKLKSINPDYDTYELPLASLQINGRVIGKWAWQ